MENKKHYANQISTIVINDICEHITNVCRELKGVKLLSDTTTYSNAFIITLPEKYRVNLPCGEIVSIKVDDKRINRAEDKNNEGSYGWATCKFELGECSLSVLGFYGLIEISNAIDDLKEDFNNSHIVSTGI